MEEKMLMKTNKLNIFQKLRALFKKRNYKENNTKDMDIQEPNIKNINTIDEMRSKREVLNLQEKYEVGNILEIDMTEDEIERLIELYKEQIKTLEENISMYQKGLVEYKKKIIEARKKYETN